MLCGLIGASLAFAACGDDSDSDSSSGSSGGQANTAASQTVFEKELAGTKEDLPAIDISVPGGTVSFKEGEALKIAYVGWGKGFAYTDANFQGAEDAAKELGVELTAFDPGGDLQKQIATVEDILAGKKYNAIVSYPLAPGLTCDLYTERVRAKGLLVALHDQKPCLDVDEPAGVLTTVLDTAVYDGYKAWAEKIVADNPDGGKALFIVGPKSDTVVKESVQAVTDTFEGEIELLPVQYTDYSIEQAQEKAQDALQSNPDLKMVLTNSSDMTRGAITAVRSAGKKGDVKVYDFGGPQFIVNAVKDGSVEAFVPMFPYSASKSAVQALVLARRGGKVDPTVINAGRVGYTEGPPPWVTPDTVGEYKSEW